MARRGRNRILSRTTSRTEENCQVRNNSPSGESSSSENIETFEISKHGDHILLVGTDEDAVRLMVRAAVLSEASAVFFNLLESKVWSRPDEHEKSSEGLPCTSLPEDNPVGMRILCEILHHNPPFYQNVTPKLMRRLAESGKKYLCVDSLAVYIEAYAKHVQSPSNDSQSLSNEDIGDLAVAVTIAASGFDGRLEQTLFKTLVRICLTHNHGPLFQSMEAMNPLSRVPNMLWALIDSNRIDVEVEISGIRRKIQTAASRVRWRYVSWTGRSRNSSGNTPPFTLPETATHPSETINSTPNGDFEEAILTGLMARNGLSRPDGGWTVPPSVWDAKKSLKSLHKAYKEFEKQTYSSDQYPFNSSVSRKIDMLQDEFDLLVALPKFCIDCLFKRDHKEADCTAGRGLCVLCAQDEPHVKEECTREVGLCSLCQTKADHNPSVCRIDIGYCTSCKKTTESDDPAPHEGCALLAPLRRSSRRLRKRRRLDSPEL